MMVLLEKHGSISVQILYIIVLANEHTWEKRTQNSRDTRVCDHAVCTLHGLWDMAKTPKMLSWGDIRQLHGSTRCDLNYMISYAQFVQVTSSIELNLYNAH